MDITKRHLPHQFCPLHPITAEDGFRCLNAGSATSSPSKPSVFEKMATSPSGNHVLYNSEESGSRERQD